VTYAIAQTTLTLIGFVAACVMVRAAAELIVRAWDRELHGTRGRHMDRWT